MFFFPSKYQTSFSTAKETLRTVGPQPTKISSPSEDVVINNVFPCAYIAIAEELVSFVTHTILVGQFFEFISST